MLSLFRRPLAAISVLVLAATVGAPVLAQDTAAQGVYARPWGMNLQPAASVLQHDTINFHWFVLALITLIVLFVMGLLAFCIVRFNSRVHPVPTRTSHNTLVEVIWTVVPVLILVMIAIPSFRLLYKKQVIPPQIDMTLKATGKQWYWSYEYPDHGNITFDSLMKQQAELKPGEPRLLAVDNEVVLPVNKNIRVIATAADVIHSFSLPAMGVKIDAIPGRANEIWFRPETTGLFYGQCTELCGRDHAFMPIAVRVVPEEEFARWIEEAKKRFASDAPATRVAEVAR